MEPHVIYPFIAGKSDLSNAAMRAALEAGLTVAVARDDHLEIRRKVKHLTVIETRKRHGHL
jgi:hypothetical protein